MNVGNVMTSALQGSPAMVMEQVSTAVLKMSMDRAEEVGASMIKMMEQSVNPNLGQYIDIKL